VGEYVSYNLIYYIPRFYSYLPYKNQGTTKDKGCTVDLLTDKVDEIVLQSGLYNSVGLGACLRKETINSNV